jgi:hypothetical protein
MNAIENYELFRYLMEKYYMLPEDLVFVENIADWCRERGVAEPDRERPFRLMAKEDAGCEMLIKEDISPDAMLERLNASRIRSQLQNAAVDRVDLLDTEKKKLAYLFLSEYATSLPDLQDELLADNWVFDEMEKLGYFNK